MLIVTSKSPGFGKQKPKQYNLAHAQYSLFRNAESLGIDPQSIKLCLPFWEGAGSVAHNLAGADATLINPIHTTDSAVATRGSVHTDSISVVTDLSFDTFSCFFTAYTSAIVLDDNDKWSDWVSFKLDNGALIVIEVRDTGTPAVYNLDLTSGMVHLVSASCNVRGETHGFCYNRDSLFVDAEDVSSAAQGTTNRLVTDVMFGNRFGDDRRCIKAKFYIGMIFETKLSPTQVSQLSDSPYALLQPVAPVFYGLPSALVPRITYPTEDLNDVSTTPTVSWSAVTGATKYKLQIDTADTFDSSAGLPLIEDEIVGGAGLLILDSHSATYKATQKPRQWGTLSAVQSAVRHNCEEWLGVPYESLKLCLPFWEGAGCPKEITDKSTAKIGSPDFSNNSLILDGSSGVSLAPEFGAIKQLTIFSGFNISSITGNHTILANVADNNYGWAFFVDNSDYITSRTNCVVFRNNIGLSTHQSVASPSGSITTHKNFNVCFCGDFVTSDLSLYIDGAKTNGAGDSYLSEDLATDGDSFGVGLSGGFLGSAGFSGALNYIYALASTVSPFQAAKLAETPYRLLQQRANKIISIGSSTPATSKQVTLATGTTHYARVAADTP